jgi:mediator of RNA polymerase II transcription subunit 11
MTAAGLAMQELAKDKPSIKQVENHSANFLKSVGQVEADLSKQIHYLTQVSSGQAHEGSTYASQKTLNMAWHRIEHAKSRLGELERMNAHYSSQNTTTTSSSSSALHPQSTLGSQPVQQPQ